MTALSFWDIGSISHGRITAMRSSSSAVSTPTLATTARRLSRPPERKGPSEELRPRAQRLSYANATSLRKCAARDQNPKRVRFSPGDCARLIGRPVSTHPRRRALRRRQWFHSGWSSAFSHRQLSYWERPCWTRRSQPVLKKFPPSPAWASAKVEDIARADAKAIVLSFILVFPL
jgi:hypothetical protein